MEKTNGLPTEFQIFDDGSHDPIEFPDTSGSCDNQALPFSNLGFNFTELGDPEACYTDGQQPGCISSPQSQQSKRGCLLRAIDVHTEIFMAAWNQAPWCQSSAILQDQKSTLQKCEELVRCQHCIKQASFIMLILSICCKVVDTFEMRSSAALPESSHIDQKMDEFLCGHNEITYEQGYQPGTVMIGLDQEDESIAVSCLLKARVARLRGLLEFLDKTVKEGNWSAHQRMLQHLWDRTNNVQE
jgi:hypothetical protein